MPKVEGRITLGNVLIIVQLLLMIWAASAAYSSLRSAVASAGETVVDHEHRIRSLEQMALDRLGRIEQRLIAIEGKIK